MTLKEILSGKVAVRVDEDSLPKLELLCLNIDKDFDISGMRQGYYTFPYWVDNPNFLLNVSKSYCKGYTIITFDELKERLK